MSDDVRKKLERVKQLIALTSSPSEEEARTSALIACRMIREHEFEIVAKQKGGTSSSVGSSSPGVRASTYYGQGPASAPFRSSLDDFFDAMREQAEREQKAKTAGTHDYEYRARDFYNDYFRGSAGPCRPRYPRVAHPNPERPKAQEPRFVLHPEILDGSWTLKNSQWPNHSVCCYACNRAILADEEVWHSRFEIRCKACSAGPVGDAFRKEP